MPPKKLRAVVSFDQFLKEHTRMANEALDRLEEDGQIVVTDEDEERAETRLEELFNKESWTEDEQLELSTLLFALTFASRVNTDDDEEGEDDDD